MPPPAMHTDRGRSGISPLVVVLVSWVARALTSRDWALLNPLELPTDAEGHWICACVRGRRAGRGQTRPVPDLPAARTFTDAADCVLQLLPGAAAPVCFSIRFFLWALPVRSCVRYQNECEVE
jgi:hypothetical protein